jgi:hypothetical protein
MRTGLFPLLFVAASVLVSLQLTSRSLSVIQPPQQPSDDVASNTLSLYLAGNGTVAPRTTTIASVTTKPQHIHDNDERAIFIISMGQEAAKSTLVERFVYSARTLGQYQGYIVLLTDAPAGRYDNILAKSKSADITADSRLVILRPLPQHFRTDFKHKDMVFKRFKTFVLEYMAMDSRLKNIRLVYYLDIDIVVAKPILDFFHGLEERYAIGTDAVNNSTMNATTASTIWMFEGNAKRIQVQGGQMILDIHKSAGCLERWRHLIDKSWKTRKDQFPLMEMWRDQQKHTTKTISAKVLPCHIERMAQKGFISFPTREEMNERVSELLNGTGQYATSHHNVTMVHIRNTGSAGTDVNETFHEIYVRDVLQFTSNQEDVLGITNKMSIKARKSDMKLPRTVDENVVS